MNNLRRLIVMLAILSAVGCGQQATDDSHRDDEGITLITGVEPDDTTPIIPPKTEADAQAVAQAFVDSCFAAFPSQTDQARAFRAAGFRVTETYLNQMNEPQYGLAHREKNISGSYGNWVASHLQRGTSCQISATVANPEMVTRAFLKAVLPRNLDAVLAPSEYGYNKEAWLSGSISRGEQEYTVRVTLPHLVSVRNNQGNPVLECGGLPACRKWSEFELQMNADYGHAWLRRGDDQQPLEPGTDG